jgi:hypothetical protein
MNGHMNVKRNSLNTFINFIFLHILRLQSYRRQSQQITEFLLKKLYRTKRSTCADYRESYTWACATRFKILQLGKLLATHKRYEATRLKEEGGRNNGTGKKKEG